MKTMRGELFTGYKGVRLEDLPEEAWRIVAGEGRQSGAAKLYATVAWLYRCVDVRAGAVAHMPYEVRKGETVITSQDDAAPEQFGWLNDLPGLLYRTEAAVALTGRAYWFRERNLLRTLAVRWLRPDSVTPVIDRDGLGGFRRQVGGQELLLDVDDVVYFWLPDPFVELGPAEHYPGKAALTAAGVLSSMDEFLTGYFDRGMIKATLLKYTQPISADEGKRVKEWWQRVVTGLKNAFATEVVRGDFDTLVIGEGLHDLQNTALTVEQREAVCTALGVPQSKVTANAANYATKQGDDLSFIQDTIAPECRWLAGEINRQLLGPMGLQLVFKPDSLPIMQEDEAQRAQSLKTLVEAGMSLEMALEVLGYDLPDGIALRESTAVTVGQQEVPFRDDWDDSERERVEETRRFLRWARKRSNPDPEQFESVILSPEAKVALLEAVAADDAPFRARGVATVTGHTPIDWQGYP